ncbi:hypothetical protein N7520_000633 [Penicillium odoratum]|uniref:uncharacterized protein n=1 Tax=Penicillium odoratum TaxID=1167516 RepID=UPI002546C59E|nr:uncharacterized protein N7520_000633 [Penicillium odoratum]KAJ5777387.1 hypothetical protein N7520_000633 [Penicillium odoratum]
MSCRYLPFEVLDIIFRDLGTEGFRNIKSNGLTICKDWRYMIEPMIYEKLHVTPLAFLNMPASSLAKVQIYTEWLIIKKEITVEDIPLSRGNETPAETTNTLADRFSEFANFLAGCTKLRSFSLHLVGTLAPSNFSNQLLSWSKSLDMIQSSSIERLEINSLGSGINPGREFCRKLSAIIPKIRHVSLKMQWICDEIFGFVDTRRRENPVNAKLELLVISLVSTGNGSTADVLSCPCSGLTVEPEFPLFRHIEERAKDVSWTFRKIKELWVVYDLWPGKIRAHEVCGSRWFEFYGSTYRTKGFDLTDDSWSRFDHEVFIENGDFVHEGNYWSDSEDPGEYNDNMSSPQDPDFDDYESDSSSHGHQ